MEKYVKELERISTIMGRANRSMRRNFIGPKIQAAGISFLDRIRSQCKGIGATEEELEEEQEILREQNTESIVRKPELTLQYLRSIGREDMASW